MSEFECGTGTADSDVAQVVRSGGSVDVTITHCVEKDLPSQPGVDPPPQAKVPELTATRQIKVSTGFTPVLKKKKEKQTLGAATLHYRDAGILKARAAKRTRKSAAKANHRLKSSKSSRGKKRGAKAELIDLTAEDDGKQT